MLIGIPGSGKSTYAEKIAKETNAIIFSSDKLREEMYGDINDTNHNTEIFTELHKRCKKELLKGNSVIYDATNINQRKRIAFLKELENIPCYKKAIILATPYELCLQNNMERDRKISKKVIENMRNNFQLPLYNEGFDEIKFVWNMKDKKFDIEQLLKETMDFDQKNSHHKLSLGKHMMESANYLINMGYCKLNGNCKEHLLTATKLHDIGKMVTQTFADSKENQSEEAHYYNHHYAGSYNAMFYLKQYEDNYYSDEDILHICILIQYHMSPYLDWKDSEKARNRDKELLGKWYDEVMILHKCDIAAH